MSLELINPGSHLLGRLNLSGRFSSNTRVTPRCCAQAGYRLSCANLPSTASARTAALPLKP
jgi:hypothetical protein